MPDALGRAQQARDALAAYIVPGETHEDVIVDAYEALDGLIAAIHAGVYVDTRLLDPVTAGDVEAALEAAGRTWADDLAEYRAALQAKRARKAAP